MSALGQKQTFAPCPLYPRKQTFVAERRLVRRIKNGSTKPLSHQSCKTGSPIGE
jgi:hypothetical protein